MDLGDFPDKNKTYDFSRVFSIRTPDEFPDPAVGQISIAVSVLPDPTTGDDILRQPTLTLFGQTSGGRRRSLLDPAPSTSST